MKKVVSIALLLLLAILFAGCGQGRSSSRADSNIPADTTTQMIDTAEESKADDTAQKAAPVVSDDIIWASGEPYGYESDIVFIYTDSNRSIRDYTKYQWIVMQLNDKTLQVCDYSGRLIGEYEDVRNFAINNLAAVEKYGKWGLIDTEGQVILPIEYDAVDYYDGRVMIGTENKYGGSPWKWGFIDLETQVVTYMDGDYLSKGYSEGFAIVTKDGKNGYVDSTGRLVIPAEYEVAGPFSEGLAAVCKELPFDFAYIDTASNVVIPPNGYTVAGEFQNGIAWVCKDGKWGAINPQGQVVIPLEFDSVGETHSEGAYFYVSKGGAFGVVDSTGQVVIPLEYDSFLAAAIKYDFFISCTKVGIGPVKYGEKYGCADINGQMVIPAEYDQISNYIKNLAAMQKDGKWGVIDTAGNELVSPEYDERLFFYGDVAIASKAGKKGFINTRGEIVIPIEYDDALQFYSGFAVVCMDGKWGVIDSEGNMIVPAMYDNCAIANCGEIIFVQQEGRWGFFTVTYR